MVPSGYFRARKGHHQPQHPHDFRLHNRYDTQTPRHLTIMTLTVRLFAAAKDLAEAGTVGVVLDEGKTVEELRLFMAKHVPTLKDLLPRCAIAVNQEFAGDEVKLKVGDEVAVIPPMSGG
jgi:molybdopterin converting factor subunit 1